MNRFLCGFAAGVLAVGFLLLVIDGKLETLAACFGTGYLVAFIICNWNTPDERKETKDTDDET